MGGLNKSDLAAFLKPSRECACSLYTYYILQLSETNIIYT